ncbi:MAG TPA: AraC family transcriptional regulator [Sphingomonadaceae bacterium]
MNVALAQGENVRLTGEGGGGVLVIPESGSLHLRRATEKISVSPERWAFAADLPFECEAAEDAVLRMILMPPGFPFLEGAREPSALWGFECAGSLAPVLADHLESVAANGARLDGRAKHSLSRVTQRLFELATQPPALHVEEAEVLRQEVRRFVALNLCDPELSVATIAREFGCTKRALHKLFQSEPMTLAKFIWWSRLETCRSALLDRAWRDHTITDVAFSFGFNNSSHFSRVFRACYGVTPTKFRRRAQGNANTLAFAPTVVSGSICEYRSSR